MANDDRREETMKDPHREGVNTSQDDLIGNAVQKAVDKLQSVIDTDSEVDSLAISLNNQNWKPKQQLNSGSDKTFEDLLYGLTESVETAMEWLGERETSRGGIHTAKMEQDHGITYGANDDLNLDDMLEKQKDISASENDSEEDSETEPYEDESSDTSENQDKKKKSKNSSRVKTSSFKFFECNECHKVFKKKWNLKVHMKTHYGDKEKNQRRHTCDCGKSFGLAHNLKRHMITHLEHQEMRLPFKCTETDCKKCFEANHKLTRHLKTHLPADDEQRKTFKCKICEIYLANKTNLNRHMQTHEADEEKRNPYKCDVCLKRFAENRSLTKHKYYAHMGGQPQQFECHLCGKKSTTKENLNSHIRNIHIESECIQTCEECGKTFKYVHYLRRHMKTHTGNWKCEICSKVFRCKQELKSHLEAHKRGTVRVEKSKPHKCDQCGNRYAHSRSLWKHRKIHTNAETEKTAIQPSALESMKKKDEVGNESEEEKSHGAWSDDVESEDESDWYSEEDDDPDNESDNDKQSTAE